MVVWGKPSWHLQIIQQLKTSGQASVCLPADPFHVFPWVYAKKTQASFSALVAIRDVDDCVSPQHLQRLAHESLCCQRLSRYHPQQYSTPNPARSRYGKVGTPHPCFGGFQFTLAPWGLESSNQPICNYNYSGEAIFRLMKRKSQCIFPEFRFADFQKASLPKFDSSKREPFRTSISSLFNMPMGITYMGRGGRVRADIVSLYPWQAFLDESKTLRTIACTTLSLSSLN